MLTRCTGDSTALLGDMDDGADDTAAPIHSSAPSAGRPKAAAPSVAAAKVDISEVRMQLQRQLKQQVGAYSMLRHMTPRG